MTTLSLLQPEIFPDYELLDSGNEERLERFGEYIVRKPDPQCLWKPSLSEWRADAAFVKKGDSDRGEWHFNKKFPDRWQLTWQNINFWVEPTPFKHLGVFPEQAAHWEWMQQKLQAESEKRKDKKISVLNLFGYTGIASVVCAKSGAFVTHVDGSKPAISWAKENMLLSGLGENSIRWILEDVLSFVRREVRRGNQYDAIIMDPPVFGHGAKGETWKFNEQFPELMDLCASLLSSDAVFMIVNAYAVSASSLMLQNVMEDYLKRFGGSVLSGELVLQQKSGRLLSTGIFGRWEK